MDLLPFHSHGSLGTFGRMTPVIPINDITGDNSCKFPEGEQLPRCKLASLYRLVDLCGWTHGIFNHITLRVEGDDDHFLINPFGMLFSEITASSLVKVDLKGDVIDQGTSQFGVSKAGFTLHSAIHEARPDIKCIIHLHTPAGAAVSSMKCGLLPISQEGIICGEVSYHEYRGIFLEDEEKKLLQEHMGPTNKILFLRNHGLAACGPTVEEAFHLTFNVLAACEAQVRAVPHGLDNLVLPNEEAKTQAFRIANQGGAGIDSSGKGWETGELEFEALMRSLDRQGYRTGYNYKLLPLQKVKS